MSKKNRGHEGTSHGHGQRRATQNPVMNSIEGTKGITRNVGGAYKESSKTS